jgi:hypothetical protein
MEAFRLLRMLSNLLDEFSPEKSDLWAELSIDHAHQFP